MLEDVCFFLVESYRPQSKVPLDLWPWEEMERGFCNTFHTDYKVKVEECTQKYEESIEDYFIGVSKDILDKKLNSYEPEVVKMALREILLSTFDQHWKDHLLAMDHVKEGINLKAYAQRDPLTEYKREGFQLFENMRETVKKAVINNIFSVKLYSTEEMEELQRRHQEELERQMAMHQRALQAQERADEGRGKGRSPVRISSRVGRNAPCPCNSGKKFKHCCGA